MNKIFPKSRFSKRIFGEPAGQLNWTGPIANSSDSTTNFFYVIVIVVSCQGVLRKLPENALAPPVPGSVVENGKFSKVVRGPFGLQNEKPLALVQIGVRLVPNRFRMVQETLGRPLLPGFAIPLACYRINKFRLSGPKSEKKKTNECLGFGLPRPTPRKQAKNSRKIRKDRHRI